MLNINFEFRKGIFFVRLFGDLNRQTYTEKDDYLKELLTQDNFRYIVLNTNYLNTIDLDGISYITKILLMAKKSTTNLIICDKSRMFSTLLNNNIPSIEDELEVL